MFHTGDTLRFALRTGSLVSAGQQITTGPKASVMLAFSNGATVTIGENAIVAIDEFTQRPFSEMFKMAEAAKEPSTSTTRLNLVRGEVLSNVKKLNTDEGSTFEVKTPVGIAGIRGTTFAISYFPPSSNTTPMTIAAPAFMLIMLEGAIEMSVNGKTRPIIVSEGKQLLLAGDDSDTDSLAPTTSPAAKQAQLLHQAQTMLTAAGAITIPSTTAFSGLNNETPAPAPTTDSTNTQPGTPDTPSETGLFPVPEAQPPAPRLSPTDGLGAP
jgi:hypothetical protein